MSKDIIDAEVVDVKDSISIENAITVVNPTETGIKRYEALEEMKARYAGIYSAIIPENYEIVDDADKKKIVAARIEINKEKEENLAKLKEIKEEKLKELALATAVYKEEIETVLEHYRINAVKAIDAYDEKTIKENESEVKAYFDELIGETPIDYITFEQLQIKVTISKTVNSLKKQIKEAVDGYVTAHNSIQMMQDKDRIMEYYVKSLNLADAMARVQSENEIAERLLKEQQAKAEAEKQRAIKEAEERVRREEAERIAREQAAIAAAQPAPQHIPVQPTVVEMKPVTVAKENPHRMYNFTIKASGTKEDIDAAMKVLQQYHITVSYVTDGEASTIGDFQ